MIDIEVSHVSKVFKRTSERYFSMKSAFVAFVKRGFKKSPKQTIYALKDVSFEVKTGMTMGLIGKNGAGKSTLLRIVSGIMKPTSGKVKIKGSIYPLLELGAGFHPELTGRENIIINGLIMGMSKKEIYKKMDEIIEFAELKDVIDEPVRTYSSGMYSRLAFSVAFSVEADIIILDEILSTGDVAFQQKSKQKVLDYKKKNKTILFVSHSPKSIREFCDEAIYLEKGTLKYKGDVGKALELYER